MWPMLLDMTEDESIQYLRHLELEAYSSLVSALRAQGTLSPHKRNLLKETSIVLNISNERHKAEVRRAISDEKLNTVAYHITGQINSLEDWAQEGRRLVPLLPRVPPQTPYIVAADDASEAAVECNKELPPPACTERKRVPTPQSTATRVPSPENGTRTSPVRPSTPFKVPEIPKEDTKKRKNHREKEKDFNSETSSLVQHLLAPKPSKIQQIYRETSRAKQKQKEKKKENQNLIDVENQSHLKLNPFAQVKHKKQPNPPALLPPKIHIIQNISIPPTTPSDTSVSLDESSCKTTLHIPDVTNENREPSPKLLNQQNNILTSQTNSSFVNEHIEKTTETTPRLPISNSINVHSPQKLMVVSNAQTLPTSSILQKTLSVPINKLRKLNLDKFKIIPNTQISSPLPLTNTIQPQAVPKPKLVTLKGNSGKKVIPLAQLQMLNPKGSLRVVPYSGKVLDKNLSFTNIQTDLIVKNVVPITVNKPRDITQTSSVCTAAIPSEKIRPKIIMSSDSTRHEVNVPSEISKSDYTLLSKKVSHEVFFHNENVEKQIKTDFVMPVNDRLKITPTISNDKIQINIPSDNGNNEIKPKENIETKDSPSYERVKTEIIPMLEPSEHRLDPVLENGEDNKSLDDFEMKESEDFEVRTSNCNEIELEENDNSDDDMEIENFEYAKEEEHDLEDDIDENEALDDCHIVKVDPDEFFEQDEKDSEECFENYEILREDFL